MSKRTGIPASHFHSTILGILIVGLTHSPAPHFNMKLGDRYLTLSPLLKVWLRTSLRMSGPVPIRAHRVCLLVYRRGKSSPLITCLWWGKNPFWVLKGVRFKLSLRDRRQLMVTGRFEGVWRILGWKKSVVRWFGTTVGLDWIGLAVVDFNPHAPNLIMSSGLWHTPSSSNAVIGSCLEHVQFNPDAQVVQGRGASCIYIAW